MREYYVIRVDYYMWDEKNDREYTEPLYLYVTRDDRRILVFNEGIAEPHYDLKWFSTKGEAEEYIKKHFDGPQCSFENARVEKIEY